MLIMINIYGNLVEPSYSLEDLDAQFIKILIDNEPYYYIN